MSDNKFNNLMAALVFISFIAGCSYVMGDLDIASRKACLNNAGYIWENNSCVMLPK